MMSDLKLYCAPIDQYERLNFPLFSRALLGVSASYVIIFAGALGRLSVNGLK